MESKIIVAPASGNTNRDTLASARSAPPFAASSSSHSTLAGAHQQRLTAAARVQTQLLAAGFTPRSLRTTNLPSPAQAVHSPQLVAWAREIVWLADIAAQDRTTMDSLVGSPSETWEVQS